MRVTGIVHFLWASKNTHTVCHVIRILITLDIIDGAMKGADLAPLSDNMILIFNLNSILSKRRDNGEMDK